jgi:hypothetical protein
MPAVSHVNAVCHLLAFRLVLRAVIRRNGYFRLPYCLVRIFSHILVSIFLRDIRYEVHE